MYAAIVPANQTATLLLVMPLPLQLSVEQIQIVSKLSGTPGNRHVKMSFIFGKRYFTFPVSQKGQISFPFPPWQKGQLYFSRYFSCTIFNKKSTVSSADLGLKSVEVLGFLKVLT